MSGSPPYRDEDWLRERWFSDMTAGEIAREAGCSDHAIHTWARRFDFPPKNELTTNAPYRDEDWLRERWNDHSMTTKDIAQEADCDRLTVERWAQRFDFPERESIRPWRDHDTLYEMYVERGMYAREIADEFDCSSTSVLRGLRSNGIDPRDRGAHVRKNESGVNRSVRRGHPQVSWCVDGTTHYYTVHRLHAIAEFGLDAVSGKVVHHKNGIPWDNRVENYELVESQAEHAKEHEEERSRDEKGRFV